MIRTYLSLVKFSHTLFAMPFALIGYTMSLREIANFDVFTLIKVVLCMVFARNAAMGFNRWLDRDIDALNPRTKGREVPAGKIKARSALVFTMINVLLFIITTWYINKICLYLSPIALSVILGYSYTKRFTSLCHFILGLGLGLAPIGAYLAVTGYFSVSTILLGVSVFFWVAGFDIIYSLQDDEFDRQHQLNSIPAWLGRVGALYVSRVSHLFCGILLTITIYSLLQQYQHLGVLSVFALMIFLSILFYQQRLVDLRDLSPVNIRYMSVNGIASVIFGTLVILDFFI